MNLFLNYEIVNVTSLSHTPIVKVCILESELSIFLTLNSKVVVFILVFNDARFGNKAESTALFIFSLSA